MQARVFGDMVFRDENSEDCLYLNVWTPAKTAGDTLPVMVWIYGGGFQAGSASEPRQDGERLARKGVVVVSFNYRLGVFGFLAHPELTKESPQQGVRQLRPARSGRGAAVGAAEHRGVRRRSGNVTIFGESAGSFSVSALMASPLAKGLFHRAIGESGAFFPSPQRAAPRAPAWPRARRRAPSSRTTLGATTLEALRAKPAEEILKTLTPPRPFRFAPIVDGYVLPAPVAEIFAKGKQASVPLLAGWNADESRAGVVLGKAEADRGELHRADPETLRRPRRRVLRPTRPAPTPRRSSRRRRWPATVHRLRHLEMARGARPDRAARPSTATCSTATSRLRRATL